ncbi:MAG: PhzF family phenazine biosynthesis protein [Clostridium sp.]|nr:PhzF family phenazine biosynthesis protein [Clostridium sp.]
MRIYIVDAFTDKQFRGNQAGVVILGENEDFPEETFMKELAAELKHSETAYVKSTGEHVFSIRYFTPETEVELCGHATISAFTVMRDTNDIGLGEYIADTLAGKLNITVESQLIWMDMAKPRHICDIPAGEAENLYDACGSGFQDALLLKPAVVNTGLSDILLPVADLKSLSSAEIDDKKVGMLSQKYQAAGIHMFCLGRTEGVTACCRNFAPLLGIPEEPATGTSNGALTYYLRQKGVIGDGAVNTFLQGQFMGRESRIFTKIEGERIRVGGSGRISLECNLYHPI